VSLIVISTGVDRSAANNDGTTRNYQGNMKIWINNTIQKRFLSKLTPNLETLLAITTAEADNEVRFWGNIAHQ